MANGHHSDLPVKAGHSLRLSPVMASNHLLYQISVNERESNPPASNWDDKD
jgi:hypothetical protein